MTTATEPAWINLGCGKFPLEGYINVDEHEPCDIVADVWDLNFREVGVVRMDHFLEHFGWREVVPLLEAVRSWLAPGGLVDIEVPDMELIMFEGTHHHDWLRYVYGSQQHDGEFHRCGFTSTSLFDVIADAGFHDVRVTRLISNFQTRRGMPCLHGTGRA